MRHGLSRSPPLRAVPGGMPGGIPGGMDDDSDESDKDDDDDDMPGLEESAGAKAPGWMPAAGDDVD